MNERDYELLSRSLDGLLSPNEAAAFTQRLMDDPELGDTNSLWEEIDMAAREAYPKSVYKRPDVPKTQSPRWLRVAVAALIAVALGGVTWAAVEYFSEEEPIGLPQESPRTVPESPNTSESLILGERHVSGVQGEDERTLEPDKREPAIGADISGQVVDSRGMPIAEATILQMREFYTFAGLAFETHSVGQLVSDSDGAFAIARSPQSNRLFVQKQGYVPEIVNLERMPYSTPCTLIVRLLRANQVTAYLRTTEGQPISGATLYSAQGPLHFEEAVASDVTDPTGKFTFTLGSYYGQNVVWGQFRGFADFQIHPLALETILYPTLLPGASLHVRVMQDGKPAESTSVHLASTPFWFSFQSTDSEGYARFANVPVDSEQIVTAFDAIGNTTQLTIKSHTLKPGTLNTRLLNLPDKGDALIRGRVRGPDGNGVADAAVVVGVGRDFRLLTYTDKSGNYSLPVKSGKYEVWCLDHTSYNFEWDRSTFSFAQAAAGTSTTHDLYMKHVTPRFIEVRDSLGQAVNRVSLSVSDVVGWAICASVELKSSRFDPVDPSEKFHVYDPDSGMAGYWAGSREEDGAVVQLDIPVGSVTGLALDAEGRPLSGIMVRGMVAAEALPEDMPWPLLLAQSDSTGLFEFNPVPKAGEVVLSLTAPGYQPMDGRRERNIIPGDPRYSLTVQFAPANARIAGRVLFADKSPAPGLAIRARSGEETWANAESNPDGFFQLYVAAGEYQLNAAESGALTTASMNITAPVSDIEWVLPVPSPQQLANVAKPSGSDHAAATEVLTALSDLFASFASGAKGGRYPALVRQYGTFMPDFAEVRNITGLTGDELNRLLGSYGGEVCYLGHLVPDEPTAMAFLDAYEAYGPEGVAGQDLNTSEEAQQEGLPRVFQLREGIERFMITDINDPNAGGKARSQIPVLWELPGNHDESGGWVVYMDGHSEWMPYPGPFPMSEAFVTRVREIGGVAE